MTHLTEDPDGPPRAAAARPPAGSGPPPRPQADGARAPATITRLG